MMRTIPALFVAIGLLTFTDSFAADETYTLKLYKSKKGDKSAHESTKSEKASAVVSAGGKEKTEANSSEEKEAYTQEILEKKEGDRRPTKLTRTYTVAEKTAKGETKKAVYAGATVLIEKKGDKYEFSIAGKALKEDEAPDLFRKFNKKDEEPQNEDLLPDAPVKVGETWTVAADKSEKIFNALGSGDKTKIDAKKSSISGKLLKAYKKDGAQFGVLEFTIAVAATDLELGGQLVKLTTGSKFVIKATVDTCIDGTIEFEDGKMDMTIDVGAEFPNVGSLTIKGTTTGTEKVRAVK